ncbi:chorismate mutase [Dichotomocladium elegans]|nr:chorismate mutase [Dichotomocladium elegans]
MSSFSDDVYSKDRIFRTLVRLEDTLICALTERAQSAHDRLIYIPGALRFNNTTVSRSFLEYFLWETEKIHAKAGRYVDQHSAEACYPFTSPLPLPSVKSCGRVISCVESKFLCPNDLNVNEDIMRIYIKMIVPSICENRDDGQYGSSAIRDIECLEALSRRIHYAKFIAEHHFRESPEIYARLARANDRQGIYDLLANRDQEVRTLHRLGRKAIVYGQTLEKESRTPVQQVISVYDRWIFPLIKQVEVDYLMIRGLRYEEN